MERPRLSIYDIPLLTTCISLAGLLSLSLAGMLAWPVFALLAILHLAVYRWLFHKEIPGYLFGVVIAAIFFIEGVRIYLQGRGAVLPALRDMIVILAVTRLVLKKTTREIYQIVGISIAECILATVFTISPIFLVGIMLDAFLIPIALYLLDGYEFQAGIPRRPPLAHFFGVFLGIMAMSTALFFIIPRPSSTIVSLGLAERRRTGFAEEVNLSHPGALEQDRSIVMRIFWGRGKAPESFYLSGARLEVLTRKGFLKRPGPGAHAAHATQVSDRLTIYPTGLDSRNVFFPFTLVSAVPATIFSQGPNYYWRSTTPPFYEVYVARTLSPRLEDGGLRFPDELRGVAALARRVAGDASVPVQVERLRSYLATHCTYSLDAPPPETLDTPIESFLAGGGKGACEHFATAMAAMLRGLDIPARVVTGFLVSEFNTTDNYYIVRASDAHAWVEYFDGAWRMVDPTPPAPVRKPRSSLIDALRFRWIRWVIEYSLQDQINLAVSVRVGMPRLRRSLSGLNTWIGAIAAVFAVAGVLVFLPRRRLGPYARVLHALKRKGLALDPALTHEEHKQRIKADWPAIAPHFEVYLKSYLAWRFGEKQVDIAPLTEAMIAKIHKADYEKP
ncbi:MAG TPA: transglutaminaseTgpA domain-containing protein [Deltaproteobacteria bacterium]|nr:transglutaminaseTgpA domain-containing protein [Deltaproteobacteria bacterium]